jgi:hypothetical protein
MEKYMQRVLKEKGHTIHTEYNGQSFDWEIGYEMTRDSEEVYYIKEQGADICLSENVYASSWNALHEIRSMILDNDSLTFMFWDNELLDGLDWEELCDELNLIFLYESEEEVFDEWEKKILPSAREAFEQDGVPDKPARRESFNNFIDCLAENGEISQDMACDICIPDHLETK